MPACVAIMTSRSAWSPPASAVCKSPLMNEANGSVVFHSGCCGASAFTRSSTKYNCTGIGCSHHKVPSLSKVAMRSETGTKSGEPGVVTLSTKLMMDCFAGPSFHDGRGSAACEAPVVKTKAPMSAAAISTGLSAVRHVRSVSMTNNLLKSCRPPAASGLPSLSRSQPPGYTLGQFQRD